MTGDSASIQVYEETSGLGPGAEVVTTGMPMSVELGPGMLDNIYDGIQRPLPEIKALAGDTITRGTDVPALNREKKWDFVPVAKVGDKVGRRRRAGHCAGDHRNPPQDHGPQRHQRHCYQRSRAASTPWPTSWPW
jgi:vacuolar-type H+-ATPase catalytic subunit A/Vma1